MNLTAFFGFKMVINTSNYFNRYLQRVATDCHHFKKTTMKLGNVIKFLKVVLVNTSFWQSTIKN